jgi:hypothetical protein
MEENIQKKNDHGFSYYNWQDSVLNEIDYKITESEGIIRNFKDIVNNSPVHAIEYYSEQMAIASITLQELKKFQDKLAAHPTIPMLDIIKEVMNRYLQLYKHHDFRHNSTSLITNAMNIWRNQAYADIYEMLERAANLYSKINK